MAVRWEGKRPAEVRDYSHDWSAFLGEDTIDTSTWVVVGATKDSDTSDDTTVTIWLSAGTNGTVARLTNTITTAGGRTEVETFTLLVSYGEEPVTLEQAKAQCRKTDDSEDVLIAGYIVAAREWVENYTNHILVSRTITETFQTWGDYLALRYRPIIDLGDIAYIDAAGDAAEYEGGVLRAFTYPARVYAPSGSAFPSVGTDGSISVPYIAGYADGDIPQAFVQAVLMLVGHWYGTRSGVSVDEMKEVPLAVKSLCAPFRVPPLA